MKKTLIAAVTTALTASCATQAFARDNITVVGSSTVFPFSTAVAETFGRGTSFKTPKIESTGTGGGMKLFCAGVGVDHPDITNASRRMKTSEFENCQANGVQDIVEVKIGFDGIAIANSKLAQVYDLTLKDIWLAMAKDVPDPKGGDTLVANPYKTWQEVSPALPDIRIEVMGPPPTSGTRDAFVELAMESGCDQIPSIKAMRKEDSKKHKAVCHGIREDGAFIEAGENDNLIVQKLVANPNTLGVFGYSFLDQNADKIQGAKINGVEPSYDTIASGEYPVSRSMFFYVKKAHVGAIPGIAEYLAEFTNDAAWGPEGYLADKGLIALPEDMRAQVAERANKMELLTPDELK
jgi:phosphate transport system substrate-binding protein